MLRVVITLVAVAMLGHIPAVAAGARTLGMGGVLLPGDAISMNPAYAAVPLEPGPFVVPLPVGALGIVTSDFLNPMSESFDTLAMFNQVAHLNTYLFNPARSPEEIIFTVDEDGLSIDFEGGTELLIERGQAVSYGTGLDLPINVGVGPVSVGVRPYALIHGRLTPDENLRMIFEEGTSSATATANAEAEAGMAFDVLYALPIPVDIALGTPAQLYAGVRGTGMLGLFRGEADLTGTIAAETNPDGSYTGEYTYNYAGTVFISTVSEGRVGYGGKFDVGTVAVIPLDSGKVTAGLSLQNIGVMTWSGTTHVLVGDQHSGEATDHIPSTRTGMIGRVGMTMNVAYEATPELLGVPWLVAADGSYNLVSGLSAHLGAESRLGILAVRAGVGYDDGLNVGLGAGVGGGGVALDVALTSHRSPGSLHQAYGVVSSISFTF